MKVKTVVYQGKSSLQRGMYKLYLEIKKEKKYASYAHEVDVKNWISHRA